MTDTVQKLIEEAKGLDAKLDSPELKDAIEALEYLGDDADGRSQEYKDLKEIVAKLKEDDGAVGDAGANNGEGAKVEAKKEEPKQKLKYTGVKQIGSLWYCKKDKYTKPFTTADECARYCMGL